MEKLELVLLCVIVFGTPVFATFNRKTCVIVEESYEICKRSGVLLPVEQKNPSNNKLTLNIRSQGISSIASNAFNNLTISTLRLESVGGTLNLEPECFDGSSKIKSLQYISGSSKNLKKVLTELRNLTELTVDNCRIVKIEFDTFSTDNVSQQLIHLSVTDANIESINPMAFASFKDLEHLNLGKNKIRNLKNGTFHGLDKLKYLTMEGNLLSSISKNIFNDLPQLETLLLIDNSLKKIESGAFSGTNIIELKLSGNELETLSTGMFDGFKKLKKLDLSNNRIGSIENGAVAGLDLLELELESNKFGFLRRGDFQGLTVKKLDLSRNNIKEIEKGAFNGSVIETLYIFKSKIVGINKIEWGLTKSTNIVY